MGIFFNKPIVNDHRSQINYSKMTNEQLLDQFKNENWKNIPTNKQKIDLLQEVENRHAKMYGRMPARVQETLDPSLLGSYNYGYHTISIRLDNNPYENLDSIIHEGQHANQTYASTTKMGMNNMDKTMIDLEKLPSTDHSKSHYVYYQEANNQDLYNIYSSELNTNNTALSFLMNQESRYGKDPLYQEYITERNEHYNRVYVDLTNLSQAKKEALLETSRVNYENRLLTENQYRSIVSHIQNSYHVDSFEQTAIDQHQLLNEKVASMDQQNLYTEEITNESMTSLQQETNNETNNDLDCIDYGYE